MIIRLHDCSLAYSAVVASVGVLDYPLPMHSHLPADLRILPIMPPDRIGEGPVWDEATARLHWIDIGGRSISSCDASGEGLVRHGLSDTPGSFALRIRGGMVMAYRTSLVLVAADATELRIATDGFDPSREHFNDGACDSHGRFWVGTIDPAMKSPVGALYRLDPDLSFHRLAGGIAVSNGIAWSPDDTFLYHCDTGPRVVYVYDYDVQAGIVGNRRVFARFGEGDGLPDGCAVDADGFLWVAAVTAGVLLRFAPNGSLDRRIRMPSPRPTGIAFGGDRLSTMFVTSCMPSDQVRSVPEDGKVFAFSPGVAGVQRHRFAG